MLRGSALLLVALACSSCHHRRPDHTDPKGVPPPAREELSWESFFHEPWPDPLHEKYEQLFEKAFPSPSRRHFAVERPFSDVKKYDLAFDEAVAGARRESASAAGKHSVSVQLPDSAGKSVKVIADDSAIRLSVVRPLPARRYRASRPEETVIPLPPGADPGTARVARDGDWIRIQFLSKNTGRPNDAK